MMNRRRLGPIRFAGIFLGGVLAAGIVAGVEPSRVAVGGVYQGADGTEARLFRAEKSSRAVLELKGPRQGPLTLYLEGEGKALAPVGLDATVPFGGKSMSLVGEGEALYGRAGGRDGEIEFYSAAPGAAVQTRSGETGSAEAIEASLVARDFVQTWRRIRAARVEVEEESLRVIPAGHESVRKQVGRQMVVEPLQPTELTMTGELSDADVSGMRQMLERHAEGAARIEDFVTKQPENEPKE